MSIGAMLFFEHVFPHFSCCNGIFIERERENNARLIIWHWTGQLYHKSNEMISPDTVDGRNPAPAEVGSLSQSLTKVFTSVRWFSRQISEPPKGISMQSEISPSLEIKLVACLNLGDQTWGVHEISLNRPGLRFLFEHALPGKFQDLGRQNLASIFRGENGSFRAGHSKHYSSCGI